MAGASLGLRQRSHKRDRGLNAMTFTRLDLTGLRCPLPALKARKALARLSIGDYLEVTCTDPLAAIDIPVLIQQIGDLLEATERNDKGIVFLISKSTPPQRRWSR
jgi:tRNA 2-thiouridine synthesizing protein A